MTGPKVVFAVLLLIAVLFAVGIGLGGRDSDPGPVDPQQLNQYWVVRTFKEMFVKQEKLDLARLPFAGQDCMWDGTVVTLKPGATGSFDVPPRDRGVVRSVKLSLVAGRRVTVAFQPAKDSTALAVKQSLEPWKKSALPSLAVGVVGGTASPPGARALLAMAALAAGSGKPVELQLLAEGGTLRVTGEDGGPANECKVRLE